MRAAEDRTYGERIFGGAIAVNPGPLNYHARAIQDALVDYKNKNIRDGNVGEDPFPGEGFDELKIKGCIWRPSIQINGAPVNYYPDAKGRYWWTLTLEDGTTENHYYWQKEGNDGNEGFSFKVCHSGTNREIRGFSVKKDEAKPGPDEQAIVRYVETGKIKQWRENRELHIIEQQNIVRQQNIARQQNSIRQQTEALAILQRQQDANAAQQYRIRMALAFSLTSAGVCALGYAVALLSSRDNHELSFKLAFSAIILIAGGTFLLGNGAVDSLQRLSDRVNFWGERTRDRLERIARSTDALINSLNGFVITTQDCVDRLGIVAQDLIVNIRDEFGVALVELRGNGAYIASEIGRGIRDGRFKPEANVNIDVRANADVQNHGPVIPFCTIS